MGGYASSVVDILAGFGFDVMCAVGVAEYQDFPDQCRSKWPRPLFIDPDGTEWPIYTHEKNSGVEVRVNEPLGKAVLFVNGVPETWNVDPLEGFLGFQGRLQQITSAL